MHWIIFSSCSRTHRPGSSSWALTTALHTNSYRDSSISHLVGLQYLHLKFFLLIPDAVHTAFGPPPMKGKNLWADHNSCRSDKQKGQEKPCNSVFPVQCLHHHYEITWYHLRHDLKWIERLKLSLTGKKKSTKQASIEIPSTALVPLHQAKMKSKKWGIPSLGFWSNL